MEASTSHSADHSWWVRGRCIGRGSFATVHTAISKSTGMIFAVKSVDISTSNSNQQQLRALENEIRVLRVINPSPYIVQYLGDDVTSSPHRNLHLEYLPNGTVSGCQKTEQLVRSYTRCLVAALRHIHARNIVHCDVKGRNVLIGRNPGECKLADFGSATEFSPRNAAISNTITPRGSPLWMAPEVLRGEYQGPESDVWSLGCTVIEMLTGKPAWADRGPETVWKIASSSEVPEIPKTISEQGRDFLNMCLRRNRAERWSSDQLLRHPFVSDMGTPSFSPRCVLDVFESETEKSEFEIEEEFDLNLNSNSNSAMEELCSGGGGSGPIWEADDDGGDIWMTVREEYSDSVTAKGKTEIMEMIEKVENVIAGESEGLNCNSSVFMKCGSGAELLFLLAAAEEFVDGSGEMGLDVSSDLRVHILNFFSRICTVLSFIFIFLMQHFICALANFRCHIFSSKNFNKNYAQKFG